MSRLPRNQVLVGDAQRRLRRLPEASVDCVVTSPPYFSLRNYGAAEQLGAEPTVHEWVDNLVAVTDELARVIKPTGVLWLNLGDSYSRGHRYGALGKGLLLGPERLVLALSERGWLVRNKVIWHKTNSMPSPVRDRLASAWEPLLLLTRSPHYFFDLDAIRIPHRTRSRPRPDQPLPDGRAPWAGPLAGDQSGLSRLKRDGLPGHPLGRNPGDVWSFATSNFRGGHHATFPEALLERPILATCPERTCEGCGRPWTRRATVRAVGQTALRGSLQPGCYCRASWQPGLVLDPFMGSGTTAVVAERLGRDWLGVELKPEYAAMTEARVAAARTTWDKPKGRAA